MTNWGLFGSSLAMDNTNNKPVRYFNYFWPFIKAAAGRAEAEAHRYNRNENNPFDWLGVDATWDERRVFDWYYLAATYERSGDIWMAAYCRMRGDEFTF